jgi:transcriptional repressor NrdR
MYCPNCKHAETKVIDSREVEEENSIRRRRECDSCNFRFTTFEYIEAVKLSVVKKDGRKEPFDRTKIALGVNKACEKRPLDSGIVERLVREVEYEIYASGQREVSTSMIGEVVIDKLKDLDHIAYIRFASIYKSFVDIDDLERAVKTLKREEAKTIDD